MKEGQELFKHVCKFCGKSFSCGRSLGGHMRSHMINDISAQADGTKLTKKKLPSLPNNNDNNNNNNGANYSNTISIETSGYGYGYGYGLRENPKKTWRIADHSSEDNSSSPVDKSCKDCGKIFYSWKALCGHMKCHSLEKEKVLNNNSMEEEQQQQQDSSTSANNQKQLVMDSQSDNETTTASPNRRKRSKRRTIRYMGTTNSSSLSFANNTATTTINNNNYASSSVSEIEQEQEEVAMCLIMLSRDVGQWGGLNSVSADSSDNNSVFFETNNNNLVSSNATETVKVESRKTDYPVSRISRKGFIKNDDITKKTNLDYDECKVELGKNLSKETEMVSKKRKFVDSFDPELKSEYLKNSDRSSSRFECTTCNKVFHSYQALGGHRASHKKTKGCFASKIDSSENIIETEQLSPDRTPTERNKLTIKSVNDEVSLDHQLATGYSENKAETSYGAKKSKGHECPICLKVFPSGQALGGHKRSHLVGGTDQAKTNQTISIQEPIPPIKDFLDLNLPAPVEEESNGLVGFNSWWIGSSHKHEPLVGLISN